MIEVADIFRRFADPYLAAHGTAMLPSHRRAITDILACRTEVLGGRLWQGNHCGQEVFSYHSCKNRSCCKCHTDDTQRWLEARKLEMLPCHYFHVTVTVPEQLRHVLRTNQQDGYALLMKAAAQAIIDIARDPRFVGGTVGVLAVLHTWTQQLHYHPHVHCLVTGGGVTTGPTPCWHPAPPSFLAPEVAIAKLVRGKLKAYFAQKRHDLIIPDSAWTTPWVVRTSPRSRRCGHRAAAHGDCRQAKKSPADEHLGLDQSALLEGRSSPFLHVMEKPSPPDLIVECSFCGRSTRCSPFGEGVSPA